MCIHRPCSLHLKKKLRLGLSGRPDTFNSFIQIGQYTKSRIVALPQSAFENPRLCFKVDLVFFQCSWLSSD